jgi:hypothetical protein
MIKTVTRRTALASAAAAPVVAAGAAAVATPPQLLKFATPADHVRAFLKLNVSLETETVFYTYTGTLEAMVPGKEIVNLCACTSIVRREMEKKPEGHVMNIWEATVYHRPGEFTPLDEFVNPLNNRKVRPFHQREGRGQSLWTDNGPSFLRADGQWVSRYNADNPFKLEWMQAGERIWVSRYSSGVYLKNPLPKDKWPLEHSGPHLIYSEKTTNSCLARDLADPKITNVPNATYSLNVNMLWWPWLLMGEAPGHLVWNAHGAKVASADAIPAQTRALVEAIHPNITKPGVPWDGRHNLWTDYPKMRDPVKA